MAGLIFMVAAAEHYYRIRFRTSRSRPADMGCGGALITIAEALRLYRAQEGRLPLVLADLPPPAGTFVCPLAEGAPYNYTPEARYVVACRRHLNSQPDWLLRFQPITYCVTSRLTSDIVSEVEG